MINVTAKSDAAGAAAAENARIQQGVIDTLRALGLGNAVSTASYSVGQNFEPDPVSRMPRPTGYAARAAIRVRLTDISAVGRIIDAALARGATGVDGVYFESSQAETLRRAAMADAAAAAHADAEVLARALGGSLGPLVSASAVGSDPRGFDFQLMRGMAGGEIRGASTTISPSEIVIGANVLVRWRFMPSK
jgi:uncharacterized protein